MHKLSRNQLHNEPAGPAGTRPISEYIKINVMYMVALNLYDYELESRYERCFPCNFLLASGSGFNSKPINISEMETHFKLIYTLASSKAVAWFIKDSELKQ